MPKIADLLGIVGSTFTIGSRSLTAGLRRIAVRSGSFLGAIDWTITANRTITIPNDTVTLLGDDRPIGTLNSGVSLRGYEPIVTVTATKTLEMTDAGTVQNCINAAAAIVTIPLNSAVAFPIGTRIIVRKTTAQTVTIAFSAGVTVLNPLGTTLTATNLTTAAILRKTGTDSWIATLYGIADPIAGSMVNPSGVSVVDFAIPAGVRRLTFLSNGLISSGTIVRLGTSSGMLTTGYNSISHFYGSVGGWTGTVGTEAISTVGIIVPKCQSAIHAVSCMTFYRISPNNWNATGQSRDGADFGANSIGNISLPGELTTFSYINPTTMTSGALQLLWEF